MHWYSERCLIWNVKGKERQPYKHNVRIHDSFDVFYPQIFSSDTPFSSIQSKQCMWAWSNISLEHNTVKMKHATLNTNKCVQIPPLGPHTV